MAPKLCTLVMAFYLKTRVLHKPALKQVKAVGFKNALSWAVAFDSAIHSGPGWWDSHKDDVDRIVGAPASAANETAWIQAYIKHRHEWLLEMAANDPEKYGILKDTVYRPNTFKALAEAGNWMLKLPVKAHSYTITAWDDFADDCFTDSVTRDVDAAEAFGELSASSRYDGRALFVQKSLKLLGFLHASATADGIFGGQTRTAVEAFQQKNGLPSTGKPRRPKGDGSDEKAGPEGRSRWLRTLSRSRAID